MIASVRCVRRGCLLPVFSLLATMRAAIFYFSGALLSAGTVTGFSAKSLITSRFHPSQKVSFSTETQLFSTVEKAYQAVFDFSDPTQNVSSRFERIDDAIMGGISTSTLQQRPDEGFARWSGICRLDGG